jgi:hypothetical protein
MKRQTPRKSARRSPPKDATSLALPTPTKAESAGEKRCYEIGTHEQLTPTERQIQFERFESLAIEMTALMDLHREDDPPAAAQALVDYLWENSPHFTHINRRGKAQKKSRIDNLRTALLHEIDKLKTGARAARERDQAQRLNELEDACKKLPDSLYACGPVSVVDKPPDPSSKEGERVHAAINEERRAEQPPAPNSFLVDKEGAAAPWPDRPVEPDDRAYPAWRHHPTKAPTGIVVDNPEHEKFVAPRSEGWQNKPQAPTGPGAIQSQQHVFVPDVIPQGMSPERQHVFCDGIVASQTKKALIDEFRTLATEGGLLLGGLLPDAIDSWLTRLRNKSSDPRGVVIRRLLSASIDYLTEYRLYQVSIGDWGKAGNCQSLTDRFDKLRSKFFNPPHASGSFCAIVGTTEVEARKFERGQRLAAASERWKQDIPFTWIYKAANVHAKEATQWKNGRLPDNSEPVKRIENVVSAPDPPRRPLPKNV